jgi:glycosyltransferase involved in cell wall biosynthesis
MIVTNVGGLPDLVPDPRWIVTPGSPAELARVIVSCLADADRLAQMAADSETVAAGLNWSDIADRTTAIYDKLVAGRGNPPIARDHSKGC